MKTRGMYLTVSLLSAAAASGAQPGAKHAWSDDNISRLLEGRRLKTFRAKPMPMLISFGDITTWLVAGEVAVASPVLAAAKEGVYQATMARLASPYEPLEYSSGIVNRAVMATRRLLLPQLTPSKLLRGLTGSRIIF